MTVYAFERIRRYTVTLYFGTRSMRKRHFRLPTAVLCSLPLLLMAACGQKGDLYFPPQNEQVQDGPTVKKNQSTTEKGVKE
ncbi:MAG: lipoprotein [Gammaproteobacteria bacterium]|nr:lipoprotein [Gammaproteobacteria bacterium]